MLPGILLRDILWLVRIFIVLAPGQIESQNLDSWRWNPVENPLRYCQAGMVELADTQVLGACA